MCVVVVVLLLSFNYKIWVDFNISNNENYYMVKFIFILVNLEFSFNKRDLLSKIN